MGDDGRPTPKSADPAPPTENEPTGADLRPSEAPTGPIHRLKLAPQPDGVLDNFIRAPPPAAVPGRVAQVNDERLEIVGQALGRGGVAGCVELVDEGLESLLSVALVGGVVKRLPVGGADALALPLGQLGQQVANAMDTAVLAV